ncbi:MAG: NVEALA domain-containing protein [Butyricimonas faecihominis]
MKKDGKEFKIIKIITAMKKSIFVLLASFCIALFFAMNVSINLSKDQSKSGLALQNIEALAWGKTSQLWLDKVEIAYIPSASANKNVPIKVGKHN